MLVCRSGTWNQSGDRQAAMKETSILFTEVRSEIYSRTLKSLTSMGYLLSEGRCSRSLPYCVCRSLLSHSSHSSHRISATALVPRVAFPLTTTAATMIDWLALTWSCSLNEQPHDHDTTPRVSALASPFIFQLSKRCCFHHPPLISES